MIFQRRRRPGGWCPYATQTAASAVMATTRCCPEFVQDSPVGSTPSKGRGVSIRAEGRCSLGASPPLAIATERRYPPAAAPTPPPPAVSGWTTASPRRRQTRTTSKPNHALVSIKMRRNLLDEVGREPASQTTELERAVLAPTIPAGLDWTGPQSLAFATRSTSWRCRVAGALVRCRVLSGPSR
jgi:hypothetical protein